MNKKIIAIVLVLLIVFIVFFAISKAKDSKYFYELEKISEQKYFVAKENDKYGVIDRTGKLVVNSTYDRIQIPNPSKDLFICYQDGKSIAINASSQQLFTEYSSIKPIELKSSTTLNDQYEKSVLQCEKNGKYGLIDFSGKKILDTNYDNIEGFSNIEGLVQVTDNNRVGIVNINGTTVVKPKYDTILSDNYYSEEKQYQQSGFIVGEKTESGYKYGYINNKGKRILKLEYNDISRVNEIPVEEGVYLILAKNGQYGLVKNKKNIINNEYQDIDYDRTNNIFIIQKNKSFGVSDATGKIIIPIENTNVQAKGEYIYVEKNNLRDVYDASGNKTNIDFYKTIMPTSNENYKISITTQENGNYYGVIGANNRQIIKSEYSYIEYAFGNYFIASSQEGKLGVIDSDENVKINLNYDLAQRIQGKDIIQVLNAENNTTELYSKDMKKICEMQNATIENENDYIKIYSNDEQKYFDSNGVAISNMKLFPNNKIYADSKEGMWGYVDASNSIKLDYEFEKATEVNEYGYASIKKDGKWGCIDSSGKIIVEPKYELNENYYTINFIGGYVMINNGYGNVYYTRDI